jgi:predicted alpha/beta hydrolase
MEDIRDDDAKPFTLPAIDGRPLAATLFEPQGAARGTLIVHGATATPQRFYRGFARFLAERGVRVITYDYRGVGRSRPASLRGYPATMTQWARLDARAAHADVARHYGGAPVAILGHSFGGQLVGLIDEAREVDGAIFVGAQLGYYGHWPLAQRARLAVLWRALVPAFTSTLGYLPGRLGTGEDLPRGVAEEWARWCTQPDYVIAEHPDAAARFARFDRPTAFYSFTDDAFGPLGSVDALLDRLPRGSVDHRRVDPEDLGKGPIGHFGFFRSTFREPLWGEALSFLTDVFEGRSPPRRARVHDSGGGRPRAPAFAFDLREEDILADLRSCARWADPARPAG